jgi:hypothetical protein
MPATPRHATDSPWFWAFLFSTAALLALAVIAPKFAQRQAHIEREFQGRQRAAENLNHREPSVGLSSPSQTLITLQPLFFALAAVTMVAWVVFWRKHRTDELRHGEGGTSPGQTEPQITQIDTDETMTG